jgi:hypothetical protein
VEPEVTMQESSAAFNLAELMRLEEQRVQQRDLEARAAREARRSAQEQRERAARAAETQCEREREAQAHQEQLRQEQARHEALQRVCLELEAVERVEREQRALHHALELARLPEPSRRARASSWLSAVLGVGLVGCAALYLGALRPALESTRVLAAEAQALAAERGHALEVLRRGAATGAPIRAQAAAPTPAPVTPQIPTRQAGSTRTRPRSTAQAPTRPGSAASDELGDLDLDSDDPFEDRAERPSPRRRTRPR